MTSSKKFKNSKKFICTGLEEVDVTLRPTDNKLVMVREDVLFDIYQQGWYDGKSDAIAEQMLVDIYKMEAEDA